MARPIPMAFLDGSALARGRALLSGGEMGAGPPVQLRHVGVQTDEDPWIAVTGGERAAQLETTLRDVLAEAEAMAEQIEEKDAQVHQLEARLRALEVRSATPPPRPAASCCASGSFGRLGEVARRWEEYQLQQPVPLRISDPGGWPTA